ncbi:transcriptional repressor [Anaerofilum sp. BX8]|uniref:Transcriptional repressor n=1 Tax=Anaerofilum hominis TaxID=2763016 RepID=A0A923I5M2_9FIRM|nr:transcriptional repressor [Anaerofilum hominis]MBC5580756.1 transcriptional repressor [Anaerofilum hominis]
MEKRNTVQKQLVLQAVRELQCHPTAEEVYQRVAARHPSISKATVYRNLNSLAEDGLVRRVAMPDAADRFDFTVGPHYHIKCAGCGRVIDAPAAYMPRLDAETEKETGFRISRHDLVFEGLCPACREKRA